MNPYHKPAGHYDNTKRKETSLHYLHKGNRFRLMFGLPLLQQTMQQEQHIDMVRTLAKKPLDIQVSLSPHKCHMLHMIDGLGDEYFELEEELSKYHNYGVKETKPVKRDNSRVVKELGDLLFYTEGLLLHGTMEFNQQMGEEKKPEMVLMSPIVMMKNLFEFGKRWIFYNQPPNIMQLHQVYMNLMNYIDMVANSVGSNLDEVRQGNWDKLSDRYEGMKYSDQKAVDRKDTKTTPDPLGADKLEK